jgi:predicted metal-dependent hydrolase
MQDSDSAADHPPPPERWAESAAYLQGVELFNRREFWESHEAWEDIWLKCDGIQAEFLQGLIQSAAALLKYQRNEPAPAKRLYATAMGRLSLCPDKYMGLDVREFQRQLAECMRPVVAGPYAALDESKIPRITFS